MCDAHNLQVLLRQTTIYLDEVKNKPFDNSSMGRGLQIVRAHMGDVKLAFLNVHLESTKVCWHIVNSFLKIRKKCNLSQSMVKL